ncbi:hypothetical protein [Fimbriimonas ginsengisoli]|uniref:Uncharacterized protein n=1 Tax=Fimbriimonas ginsengisoli Gsoil 348 TaxID=661478 RepID=A0A068NJW3_FIMGI|nr:hypothetical protein [Fimbriimonas ginsengisoli]AIE83796.1 hypothetical protein OP10G_0428 [Fimbriimonas ginsengisoli Gsoil 348]
MAKLTTASTLEYQAAVFGAGFIGFGLGFLLKDSIGVYSIVVMVIGILLHGWGMYRIHRRDSDARP